MTTNGTEVIGTKGNVPECSKDCKKCAGVSCGTECKCGSGCRKDSQKKCPFVTAHPNWQKCPFMSKMFGGCGAGAGGAVGSAPASQPSNHEKCDESRCALVPETECTSYHRNNLTQHVFTLQTDTEQAADQSEEAAL